MKRLYLVEDIAPIITVINLNNRKIIAGINVNVIPATMGNSPNAIAISPNGKRAYVTTSLSAQGAGPGGPGFVIVINTITNKVIRSIPVGKNNIPGQLIVTPNGNRVWVVNTNLNSVNVINTHTNQVKHILPVGKNPIGIAVTPDGKFVWVTNEGSNSISIFRTLTKKIVATIRINQPGNIVIAPNGKHAYVNTSKGVSIIDVNTRKIISKLPVSGVVAVSNDSTQIIVGNGNTLSAVNALTNRVIRTVKLSNNPIVSLAINDNQLFINQSAGRFHERRYSSFIVNI